MEIIFEIKTRNPAIRNIQKPLKNQSNIFFLKEIKLLIYIDRENNQEFEMASDEESGRLDVSMTDYFQEIIFVVRVCE